MKVKMLTDAPGSPDGYTVNQYSADGVYEVTDDLGRVFVDQGLAVEDAADVAPEATPELEPAGEDEENVKKASGPRENK